MMDRRALGQFHNTIMPNHTLAYHDDEGNSLAGRCAEGLERSLADIALSHDNMTITAYFGGREASDATTYFRLVKVDDHHVKIESCSSHAFISVPHSEKDDVIRVPDGEWHHWMKEKLSLS